MTKIRRLRLIRFVIFDGARFDRRSTQNRALARFWVFRLWLLLLLLQFYFSFSIFSFILLFFFCRSFFFFFLPFYLSFYSFCFFCFRLILVMILPTSCIFYFYSSSFRVNVPKITRHPLNIGTQKAV